MLYSFSKVARSKRYAEISRQHISTLVHGSCNSPYLCTWHANRDKSPTPCCIHSINFGQVTHTNYRRYRVQASSLTTAEFLSEPLGAFTKCACGLGVHVNGFLGLFARSCSVHGCKRTNIARHGNG